MTEHSSAAKKRHAEFVKNLDKLAETFNEQKRQNALLMVAVPPLLDVRPADLDVSAVPDAEAIEKDGSEGPSEDLEDSEQEPEISDAMERAIKELQPNKRAKYDVFASGRGLELFMKVTDTAGSLDPMLPKKLSKNDNPLSHFVISESLVKAMAVQRRFLKDKLATFN